MNRVSLYIPCFNASGYLKECLEAVLKQTYPIYEILVIDDGSTDDTLKIASTFAVKCISNERNLGLAAVRNIAIRQAKGDLIASLDADCSPDPFWLQRLMEDITDERIAGAGGRVLEKEGGLADIWRKNHMPQDWGKDRIINPQFLYGANTLFRKNALEAIGLYNEEYKTNNEDVDISTRLRQKGFSLVYDPQALVSHLCKDNISSLVNRFWRWRFHYYLAQGFYKDFHALCKKIKDNMGLGYGFVNQDRESGKPYLLYIDFFLPTALTFKDMIFYYHSVNRLDWDYSKKFVGYLSFSEILYSALGKTKEQRRLLRKDFEPEKKLCMQILLFGQYLRKQFPRINFYKIWLRDIMEVCFGQSVLYYNFIKMIEEVYEQEGLLDKTLDLDEADKAFHNCLVEHFEKLFDYPRLELIKDALSSRVLELEGRDSLLAQEIIESSTYLFKLEYFEEFKEDCDYYYSRILNKPLLPPKMIQFDFMRRCQLQCRICKIWKNEPTKPSEELNFEEASKLIKEAADSGIKHFYISGGEPLMLPYFFELMQLAVGLGMFTELTTNGLLLNEQYCEKVVSIPISQINISLDGASAKTHDYHRNYPGLFDIVTKNIQRLVKLRKEANAKRPAIIVSCVLTNKNFHEMLDFVKMAEGWSVEPFFQPYVSENDRCYYRSIEDEFSVPKERLKDLYAEIDRVIQYKHERNAALYGSNTDFINNTIRSLEALKDYFSDNLKPAEYCYAGFSRIHILSNHKVNLCPGDIGDFSKNSLKEILSSAQARKMREATIQCKKPCFISAAYYPGPSASDIFVILKKHLINLHSTNNFNINSLSMVMQELLRYRGELIAADQKIELNKLDIAIEYLKRNINAEREVLL